MISSISAIRLPSGGGKLLGQGMSPAQAGKPCVIAVRSDPFRPDSIASAAKYASVTRSPFAPADRHNRVKNLPVPLARRNGKAGIVPPQLTCIIECAFNRCRVRIDLRMRDNSDERRKVQFRDSEALARIHRIFKPSPIFHVIPGILTVGINQDVNVEEDH